MRVIILIEIPKFVDGKAVGPYTKGADVNVPDSLAKKFIDSQMAAQWIAPKPVVSPAPPAAKVEKKAVVSPAPPAAKVEKKAVETTGAKVSKKVN